MNERAEIQYEGGIYPWLVLLTVVIGTFMGVVDSTIVNVGLPKIKASFGVTLSEVQWVSTAYLLVLAVMLLLSPWLGEQLGHKTTFIIGLSFFTGFSLLCGLSWNLTSLLLFRGFQGFGGGILGTVGMVLWRREFPPDKQALPMGIYMVAVGGAVAMGPPLGGWLIQDFDWPSIFFVNVPVGIIGVIASFFVLRKIPASTSPPPLDWLGFLSLSLFLTAMLTAVAEGNASWNTGGWTSPFIMTCYFLTVVGLVVFVITEIRAEHPLVDLRIFLDFNFALGSVVFFSQSMILGGIAMIGPLYTQQALGYSQLESGLVMLPIGLVMSTVGILAGAIAGRVNMKLMAAIGLLIFAYGCYLASRYGIDTERSQIMRVGAVSGFGLGLLITPLSTLMLAWMPSHLLGSASGAYQAIRNVAGAVGVALFQTMLTRRQIFHSAMYGQSAARYLDNLERAASKLRDYLLQVSGEGREVLQKQAEVLVGLYFDLQSFVSSVDDDYYVGAITLLICVVPTLFLRVRKGGAVVHITE